MKAISSSVVETLGEIEFEADGFDPWRGSWDGIVAFYRSLGIEVSGLSSCDPAKHRIKVPQKYFRTGAPSSEQIVNLNRVNRPNKLAPNDDRLVVVKRRILRVWAILILHKKTLLLRRANNKPGYGWSSSVIDARALCEVARVALIEGQIGEKDGCPDGPSIFSHITEQTFLARAKQHVAIFRLNESLSIAKRKGLIDDWFSFSLSGWAPSNIKAIRAKERGRREKKGQNEHEPFDDDDLGRILETCASISGLTDNLLAIYNYSVQVRQIPQTLRPKEFRKFLLKCEANQLGHGSLPFVWKMKNGELISQISDHPKPIQFVRTLLVHIQAAHMQLLNFLLMLRKWETQHLPFDALRKDRATDLHLMTGNLAKTAFGTDGDKRDWPVAPLALKTIERQQKLTRALSGSEGSPTLLFFPDGVPLGNRYALFWSYIRNREGHRLIKEQSMAPTRYRASACRLVVLAELGGDNIARQIMGHENLATTTGYANANGRIASELLATRARVQQVMGKQLLNDYMAGRLPKRSFEEISSRLKSIQHCVGEDVDLPDGLVPSAIRLLGTSDTEDIAGMLGEDIRMTAPGVFCNRMGDQIGACRTAVREVNPGRCNENKSCMYRLETGDYLLDQAERIENYLGMLKHKKPFDPRDFGFYHIVVALLDCFYEIHGIVEGKAHDPRVHEVLDAIDGEMFEELLPSAQRAFGAIQEIREVDAT